MCFDMKNGKKHISVGQSQWTIVRMYGGVETYKIIIIIFLNVRISKVSYKESSRSESLTAHNWQNWKRVFPTCPCHKI